MNDIEYSLSLAEESHEQNEAEQILAVALLSSTARSHVPALLAEVAPEDFYDTIIGSIWARAHEIIKDGQPITRRGLLIDASEAVKIRLKRLSGEAVQFGQLRASVDAVLEAAKTRRLVQALKAIAQHVSGDVTYSESLHFANEQLAALAEAKPSGDVKLFADLLEGWHEWLDAPKENIRTFPTPWLALDDFLAGGLHAGRTYVIGARPGDGKSLALLNLAARAAERGHPGVIFSVEMGDIEVVSRIMAAGAQAKYGQITHRSLDENNRLKLAEYADSHGHMPLAIIDRSDITVEYIAAQCRTLKRRPEGLDVVVVDYLQLLRESDSKQTRERQVAQISRALKILARDLDVAILIACQLNRNSANADRKPTLSELRESGSIEQDADVVILLHHELVNNARTTGEVTLCIAKNRTGRLGELTRTWRPDLAMIG